MTKLSNFRKQEGATLLVSLIILLLLTVVGLASMDVTTVDVKVAANAKDRQMAFNDADSELFEGGEEVSDATGCLVSGTGSAYVGTTYSSTADANSWWANNANWSFTAAASSVSGHAIEDPTVVADAPAANRVQDVTIGQGQGQRIGAYYPVTARAQGPGATAVILESYYMKIVYDSNGCI